MDDHMEELCYSVHDLMKDAYKWKHIYAHAETEAEKNMAKRIMDNLMTMHKDSHDWLASKINE